MNLHFSSNAKKCYRVEIVSFKSLSSKSELGALLILLWTMESKKVENH